MTLAAGFAHTCAVTDSGAAKCWGDNYSGQLGDGTREHSSVPVDVVGIDGRAVAIAADGGGYYAGHTCVVLESGGIQCWGVNKYGQLGNGAADYNEISTTPEQVVDWAAGRRPSPWVVTIPVRC